MSETDSASGSAVDADGVPLDLGRTQRLFSGEQRRAVLARDRECIWPSCHLPARWCEIHHLKWWERDGGPTSVDNLVLLCGRDHRALHAGRLEARFGEDGLPETRRLQRDLGSS